MPKETHIMKIQSQREKLHILQLLKILNFTVASLPLIWGSHDFTRKSFLINLFLIGG